MTAATQAPDEVRNARTPAAPQPRQAWLGAWIDRLNPILVREMQQAAKGKVFLLTLYGSLAAIVLLAAGTALTFEIGGGHGNEFFFASLMAFAPVVTFLVPIQAFLAMRLEVTAGLFEQLALTDLRPRRIVRGKLLAAGVQFALFLALFGPMLAMTYLLRGIDVPTIAFLLVLGVLGCLALSAFAMLCGALCRFPAVATPSLVVCALNLGGATVGVIAGLAEGQRDLVRFVRDADFWGPTSLLVLAGLLGVVLLCMAAGALLTHPHENRSTPFRVFALLVWVVASGWTAVACWQWPSAFDARWAAPGLVIFLALASVPFWLFAVTEERDLSPRVRTQVPRRPLAALLVALLLPGGGRGLLFTLCLAVSALLVGFSLSLLYGVRQDREMLQIAGFAWCYVLIYAALGTLLRRWLKPGIARNWLARVLVPGALVLFCLLPVLLDLLVQGTVRRWHVAHLLDPFFTVADLRFDRHWRLLLVALLAGALLVPLVRPMLGSVREVLAASRERRTRAS